MTQTPVYLDNFHQNAIDHPRLHPCVVYADLHCMEDGRLMIAATLGYICEKIQERKYLLVPKPTPTAPQSPPNASPALSDTEGAD